MNFLASRFKACAANGEIYETELAATKAEFYDKSMSFKPDIY